MASGSYNGVGAEFNDKELLILGVVAAALIIGVGGLSKNIVDNPATQGFGNIENSVAGDFDFGNLNNIIKGDIAGIFNWLENHL